MKFTFIARLPLYIYLMCVLLGCKPAPPSMQSITNVSRDTALEWSSDLYLPTEATHVFAYEKAGGLQDLERFYRFEVPPGEIELAVDYILASCEKRMNFSYSFERTSNLTQTYVWPHWVKSELPWWEADLIKTGFYHGSTESYGARVWADERSGTIYVYQND